MATHSSILAWRIPWTEEPGGLQSMGSRRVRHSWSDLACMHQPSIQAMTIFTNALCVCVCVCVFYLLTFPWLLLQVRSLSRHCQSFFLGIFCLHFLPSFNPFFIFLPKFSSKAQLWSSQSLPHKLSSAPLCLQNKSYALLMAFKTQTTLFRFVQLHYTSYATVRLDISMILKHFYFRIPLLFSR